MFCVSDSNIITEKKRILSLMMELDEEVKKYFKDLLECPVCFETIDSVPIYQCRNGHVVCKDCHPKLETCPICRELRDGPIRNLKLEDMVERLQLSISEATKKLTSESIQIDAIEPETPNVCLDTNQETRQATVELNIVEDDENVTSELGSCQWIVRLIHAIIVCLFLFLLIGVGLSVIGVILYASGFLFSIGTTDSVFCGCIFVVLLALLGYSLGKAFFENS